MYGSSLKCDVCGNIDFIDHVDQTVLMDCYAPDGWIRIHVNRPKAWSFDKKKDYHLQSPVGLERYADCCSIDCARSILHEAYDTIPIEITI